MKWGGGHETGWDGSSLLDHVPVDADLEALALLFEGLGEHELAHPVNAVVAALDGEVVRLAGAVDGALEGAVEGPGQRARADGGAALALPEARAEPAAVRLLRNQLEVEGGDVACGPCRRPARSASP